MNLQPDTVVKRSDKVVSATMNNLIVLMSIGKGNYYGFDDIASHIWTLLEEPKTVERIVNELRVTYDVSEEACRKSVVTFLYELSEHEMVEF